MIGDEMILERLYAAEEMLRTQAAVLDSKAGILLIILTFLAGIVLNLHFAACLLDAVVSVLILAGALTVGSIVLLPYRREDANGLVNWRNNVLAANSGHSQDDLEGALIQGLISASMDRVKSNEKNNKIKSGLLLPSYVLTLCAFVISVVQIASQLH